LFPQQRDDGSDQGSDVDTHRLVDHDPLRTIKSVAATTRLLGGFMRVVLDRLYLWAGYVAGSCLVVTLALMMFLAIGRQVGINIPDGTDFASWSMAAMSFLGMAHTFKRGEMIRVGLLLEKLKGRPKHVAEVTALSITLAFLLYFTWHAFDFVRVSRLTNEMSNGVIAVPIWLPQLSFLAGAMLLTVAVLDELIHVLKGNPPTFEKPPPKTTEELLARVAEGGGV
jgi:TRAP-type C4-dicarboxylate transport system permease small subunit